MEEVITVFGRFDGANITEHDTDKQYKCVTYGKDMHLHKGADGFFNLKWSKPFQDWIIFQYLLVE